MREIARKLYLLLILGSSVNNKEFRELLYTVYNIDCFEVPVDQTSRGTSHSDASVGMTDNAGNYVWYDPQKRVFVTYFIYRELSRASRLFYGYMKTGFVLVSEASVAGCLENSIEPIIEELILSPVIDVSTVVDPVFQWLRLLWKLSRRVCVSLSSLFVHLFTSRESRWNSYHTFLM